MNNRLNQAKKLIEGELRRHGIEDYELGFELDPTTGGYITFLTTANFMGMFSDSNANEVIYFIWMGEDASTKEDSYMQVSLADFLYALMFNEGKITSKDELVRSIYDLLDVFKKNVKGGTISSLRPIGDMIEIGLESGEEFELTIQEKGIA